MLRSNIYIAIAVMIALGGCRTVYAPLGKMAKSPEEFVKSGKGGWLTLRLKTPHPEAGKIKGGEFLWQDDNRIYLLTDTVTAYQKSVIGLAVIEVMEKRPYAWWWILGSVSTLSHGLALIYTFPTWQVVGISATTGEFWHDVYEQEEPGAKYWQEVNLFARFPGGIEANEELRIEN